MSEIQGFRPRTVYDGFYHWRARVMEVTNWRGQVRYLAVLDRFFGKSWRSYWLSEHLDMRRGRLRKTEAQAEDDATKLLDERDESLRETGGAMSESKVFTTDRIKQWADELSHLSLEQQEIWVRRLYPNAADKLIALIEAGPNV